MPAKHPPAIRSARRSAALGIAICFALAPWAHVKSQRSQAPTKKQEPAPRKALKGKAPQGKTPKGKARGEATPTPPRVEGERKKPRIQEPTKGSSGPFHDLRRAMALLGRARVDAARTMLEGITKKIPEHAEAWHMLATCHELKQDRTRARKCGKRALELLPTHARAALLLARLNLTSDALAAADYARRTVRNAGKDIVVKRNAARILMETGNLDEAKKVVDALSKIDPRSQRLLFVRAELATAMRDMTEAKRCYKLLSFMRRGDPIPHENLAGIYESEGDAKQALKAIEAAVKARPSKRELHQTRIRLLKEVGASQERIQEARQDLNRALARTDAPGPDSAEDRSRARPAARPRR